MTTCRECKKEYETYPVILGDKVECMAFEICLKEFFYDEKKNMGLCKKCRENLMKNKVWIWRHWLVVKANIMVIESKARGKDKKTWEESLKRIEKIGKELEKLPEIKRIIKKNTRDLKEKEIFW